jgi:hypothetical protein
VHLKAFDYVKDLVKLKTIHTEREVLTIHNLILRDIKPEGAGCCRKVQVMIKGSAHLPPQPNLVSKQLEEYF